MWGLIIAIHVVFCILVVIIILLQSGKGSDIGAAFGGSSQTVFGPRGGATFLSKLTTGIAVGFLVTSLSLAYLSSKRRESSLIKEEKKVEEKAKTKADETTKPQKEVPVKPKKESKGVTAPKEPEKQKPAKK